MTRMHVLAHLRNGGDKIKTRPLEKCYLLAVSIPYGTSRAISSDICIYEIHSRTVKIRRLLS